MNEAAAIVDALRGIRAREVSLVITSTCAQRGWESRIIHTEIGELLLGTKAGRTSPDQITLYKSVGVAAQDAAAAYLVVTAARQQGLGSEIHLSG